MSEKILKALMQLFAIIARPESNRQDRRTVVESFLKRQLNSEIVQEYLVIFDEFYAKYQATPSETGRQQRKLSASSVRVLKICTEINEELTQEQKIIVLFQLFEFVLTEGTDISEQEIIFIDTVADAFHILAEEYGEIKDYIFYDFTKLPNTHNVLVIDNDKDFFHPKVKHLISEALSGQIRILHITSTNMYFAKYMGKNEMYLNNTLFAEYKAYVLNYGSFIRGSQVRPIYYSDIVSQFFSDRLKSKVIFEVKNVEYKFKSGKLGLHNISFSEESGRLVGIMGASGAGKSTLLNVLNGNNAPSQGEVTINGISIHKGEKEVEGVVGFVSQDDLLIEDLSVYQNLYYNAKLCFDNYSEEEIEEAVERTLVNLGLFEIKDIQVGSPLNKKISGGQRKRLNIALELIREPAVLFLDEPTSGLSSRDSENILDLLKELTFKGKLVFVVIHQPSSDIFKMFDRLIILDTGGFLIYNGDPIESIIYFKSRIHHANWNESECHECGNVNPEQVFNIVESRVLNEYGQETYTRRISPKEWSAFYEENGQENKKGQTEYGDIPESIFKIPHNVKQFLVFAKRDILSKLSNTQYLVITFLEAPILAFIMAFIIKYYNVDVTNQYGYTLLKNSNMPVYIFMSVIIAIFMGMTGSAEEIIKDRKILKRESFLNLSWGSYLFSKVFVLLIISAIQALTYVLIGNSIMEIHGMYFEYWLVLFSSWVAANMMGFIISDSFKTVVTIYMLIPFMVIPQIILSGVLVKYEKINPLISSPSEIPIYGEAMTARWGYEALAVYQFIENDYYKNFYKYYKAMSIANYKKDYWATNLKNKLDFVGRYYKTDDNRQEVLNDLDVLRNEIRKETKFNPKIQFIHISELYIDKLNEAAIEDASTYLDQVNRYYIKLYNKANDQKDKIVSSMQETTEDREKFLALRRGNHNESLEEVVTNSNEVERVVEYKGRLIQKIDPIYLDPEHPLLKSHFYAPRKKIGNTFIPTFWVNVMVIWLMTGVFFLLLYYRILLKGLDYLEQLGERFSKNE